MIDLLESLADAAYPDQLTKGVSDANWNQSIQLNQIGNISVKAANTIEKQLTPKQCYELSIAVRKAVGSIADQISQAQWRVMTPSGEEVTAGPLVKFLKKPCPWLTMQRWCTEMISWWNIAGEMAAHVTRWGDSIEAFPLIPYQLSILSPQIPKSLWDVREWMYYHLDGSVDRMLPSELVYERMFNVNQSVRGLSPLVTGAVEVGSSYASARYRKTFFENSAVPSHILILPDGTSRQQREEVTQRYLSEFGAYSNNAHKVMVIAGKDAKIEKIQSEPQEGAFMELSRWNDQQIAMLYGVPAIEMGFYDKTRFDTANEERKLFVEKTLMPQMRMLSEVVQFQIVDRYFTLTPGERQKATLTKSQSERFEQLRAERDGSAYIVFLDPDTLPIMAAVKAAMIEQAEKFRKTLMLSPRETANWFKIDIPERPERDDVWIENNLLNVTHPEMNEKLHVFTQNGPSGAGKTSDGKPDKDKQKKAEKAVRSLRRLTLDCLDEGRLWSLQEADAEVDDQTLNKAVRVIRHYLADAVKSSDPKRSAKDYFNGLDIAQLAEVQ